jgi:hypothetical protein
MRSFLLDVLFKRKDSAKQFLQLPMRNLTQLLIAGFMLASQVTTSLPIATVTAQSTAPAIPAGINQTKIALDTQNPAVLDVKTQKPNIETEMLNPIRTAQAEKAAEAEKARLAALATKKQVRKVATTVVKTAPVAFRPVTGPLSAAAITALGMCESGMTATRNSGNGYYGAFQFSAGTWNRMGTGYARADLAPLDVQISAVQKLLSGGSSVYGQFPACARKMAAAGLI